MPSPTRAKIAKELSLSRTTVSTLVKKLISIKLATEIETEEHKNGRPGVLLSPDASTWHACGASFDQNAWTFVIVNLLGDVVYRTSLVIDDNPIKLIPADDAMDALAQGIRNIIESCPGRMFPAIGIGVPGYIDRMSGEISFAADLSWQHVPVSRLIMDKFKVPSIIMNRHMTSGLAESRIGVGKDVRDLVYVGISTGLITCQLCNGNFLFGQNPNQGEIGHTIIDPNGPVCACGKHGCLQAVVSHTALCNKIMSHYENSPSPFTGRVPSLSEIYEIAVNDKKSICAQELKIIIKYVGMLCSNLINMFNPEKIVIGGPVSVLFKGDMLEDLVEQISQFVIPHPFSKSMICTSNMVKWGSAIGAAFLVIDNKLNLVC